MPGVVKNKQRKRFSWGEFHRRISPARGRSAGWGRGADSEGKLLLPGPASSGKRLYPAGKTPSIIKKQNKKGGERKFGGTRGGLRCYWWWWRLQRWNCRSAACSRSSSLQKHGKKLGFSPPKSSWNAVPGPGWGAPAEAVTRPQRRPCLHPPHLKIQAPPAIAVTLIDINEPCNSGSYFLFRKSQSFSAVK